MITPNLLASRSKYSRLITAFAVSIGAWIAGTLGAFQVMDGPVYDCFMRFRSRVLRQAPKVFLVEIDEPRRIDEETNLLELLEKLGELGADQIVFNFLPAATAKGFYGAAERAGNVLFPTTLVRDPFTEGGVKPREHPELTAEHNPSFAILHPPPASSGVHRSQHGHFVIDGSLVAALEVRAYERSKGTSPYLGGLEYLIDFRGGPGSLPNLPIERVIAGDLIPDLVRGACVLVGARPSLPDHGLYTPTTSGLEAMSLLEYQGHALNTLLTGRRISPFPHLARLALLMGIALLSNAAYPSSSAKVASWLTAGLVLSYAAGSLAAFLWLDAWVPMTEVAVSQVGIFLMSLRGQAIQLQTSMEKIISDTSVQLRDQYWPIHCRAQSPSWPLIANMINQTLDLNRLIFLEADTQENRLREILALHCSVEDISERRRDYRRPPYSDALHVKGPIQVKKFFETKSQDEEQYLAPLLFGGELLGFWAIGIEASKSALIPQFLSLLRDYGASISELLHQAREENRKESRVDALRRRLGTERTSETYQQLSSTLGLLQHRLGTLDLLINRLNSGIIVYDIFGRVRQINQLMLESLKKENLAPFEMTALDLILAISDYDISKSRRLLRRVIVENSTVSFPVTFRSSPAGRFILHLKPLHEEMDEEAAAFNRRVTSKSILCELVDTTALTGLHEMKSRLTERLGLKLRSDLACVELSAGLLDGRRMSLEDNGNLARIIEAKVRDTIQTLGECQQYLALDSDSDDLERFPVDPKLALTGAVEDVQEAARKRGVDLRLQEPSFISYVFASTSKLRELFGAMLRVLCQDAADHTTVLIRVAEDEDVVVFDFSNMGFGIPNELFQGYVFGEQQLVSEEFQKIKTAALWVQSWGGRLEAASGVGVGIHFTLQLVKFT